MNNHNANSFPFNFMGGQQQYCQTANNPPPLPPLAFAASSNASDQGQQVDNMSSDQQQQQLQQNQQQDQQQPNAQQIDKHINIVASFLEKNSNGSESWQSCRYCQQRFFVSAEGIARHELSCPVNIQVQQFLQQQQQQQQQPQQQFNDLQQQLQLQHNQLQQQFQQQQQQSFGSFLQAPFAQSQDAMSSLQMQIPRTVQGLDLLSQQSLSMGYNEQNPSPPVDFETAVANLPTFNPPSQQTDPNATDYFPLSRPEDEEWLTPLHCFVRKYCVEVFVATPADVAAPCMGKRNPVTVEQVGIRCPYCSPERMKGKIHEVDAARARENGVVYPSLISRIYNATINLLQRHLRTCAYVPPEILARYDELKNSNARSGASKKYWADAAAKMGLVDRANGIYLDKEVYLMEKREIEKSPKVQGGDTSQAPIVLPTDKRYTTNFTFHVMSQLQPCTFTEADRLGRRRGLEVGYAGLACRHCVGGYGSGRFFPSSVKTMSDASKTLDVVYKHMCKCKKCPTKVKKTLHDLRRFHDSERAKMPFGNQRAFFTKIWTRLHEKDSAVSALPSLPAAAMAPPVASLPVAMAPVQPPSIETKHGESSTDSLNQQVMASMNRTTSAEPTQNKVAPESA
jgi:sarcosine oxidase delta subunit